MEGLDINYEELKEMDIEEAKSIVSELCNECFLEDVCGEVNGVMYSVEIVEEGSWDDEGKYQYKSDTGVLRSIDKDWNVIDKFDIAVTSDIVRSGSYYSDYYYDYGELQVQKIVQKIIPEQIIPEHTIVVLE